MARSVILVGVVYATAWTAMLAGATPTISFPFNSQVPTVARTNEAYDFQISASTFAPQDGDLVYSLTQQPAWLSIDSATGALTGTPGTADVGSSKFTMTAADATGAAHMPCTIVVASDPAPRLRGDLSQQLATEVNLTSSNPATATLLPGSEFSFNFRRDSFIDIVQRTLYYYATLANHTPLPAWLNFQPAELSFSGTAPQLSAFPQSFQVDLIASDVDGFAGATATFTIIIAQQQLVFSPSEQSVDFTPGSPVQISSLSGAVYLNGQHVDPADLQMANASLPEWLTFDPKTLVISGDAPQDAGPQNGSVTVTDRYGNVAQTFLRLVPSTGTLFSGNIGTLTVTPGEMLDYTIPTSVFSDADATLSLTIPTAVNWLTLDSSTRELKGLVPSQAAASMIQATLSAKGPNVSGTQTQGFSIEIEDKAASGTSSSLLSSRSSSTNASTASPSAGAAGAQGPRRLDGGVIAAIVLASLIVLAALIVLLIMCCLRRRRRGYETHSPTPSKRSISRPILPSEPEAITVTTQVQRDVEKAEADDDKEEDIGDAPPQIALEIPSRMSRSSKWDQRVSHLSQASSLGNGEDAIKGNSNIPEWGRESAALHAPHDSFSIPAEMARVSRQLSDASPSKRALKRLGEKRRSRQSIGLGIDTGGAGMARHSSRRGGGSLKRKASSTGLSATMERSSCASLSTRGTSLLSTRPSDFPRPPTESTFAGSKSIPTLSVTDPDQRKSIRLIGRSDSVEDHRPIEEKRQSFIRKRASTSLQSPLFSRGSRTASDPRQLGPGSSSDVTSHGSRASRRRTRMDAPASGYSQSSSLGPREGDGGRLSQRVRSTFAPNFPRAVTRSSLGADDDNSSDYYTTSSSSASNAEDLAAEMTMPRHMRSWVLPGEASPTPPPAPPASRQPSSGRRADRRDRLAGPNRSSSPLAYSTTVIEPADGGKEPVRRTTPLRRSLISEPLSLVSNDSLSRGEGATRPLPRQIRSKRPVSVEEAARLGSLRAEREADAQGGSEMWEEVEPGSEGAGLAGPATGSGEAGTQKSQLSGKVFL